tara:strand:+ start:790 stop:4485 length:3696 start_codon:yes stop_codon:yes gene_type:complete
MRRFITIITLCLCSFIYSQVDYETQIQPIFDANCVSCHSNGAAYTGGIELTSFDELMAGGYTTNSTNVLSVLDEYVITGYMPAWGADPLSDEEINLISSWIFEGGNPSLTGCEIDIDNDGICDEEDDCVGTWVEDITTGSCYDINDQATCISYGCSWTNEYTGVWLWEDVCGYQGDSNYTIDNSYCEELSDGCISDTDEDGICEDNCPDDMPILVFDCECTFINPNTYTVFETTVNEEFCEIWEECSCECINDVNENGICDEEETIDCPCINPDWIDPMAICPWVEDPVTGCDGITYSNSCLAQAAGVTAWTSVFGTDIVVLEWDCNNTGCVAELDPNCLSIDLWDPVCGCDGVTYGNSQDAECNNIFEYTLGECGIVEEGCWEEGEFYSIGYELFIDNCTYVECEGPNNWSAWIEIENCGEDINCTDDPDGILVQYGLSCPELLTFGCDTDLSSVIDSIGFGISIYEICPESCNTCSDDISGCMDPSACNYSPSATTESGTCFYEGDPECEDCETQLNFMNYGDNESFSATYNAPPGLIITINFSGSTESCCDQIYVNGVQYNGELDGVVVGGETLIVEWTTDSSVNSASGYGWSAELLCEEPIYGCTQSFAENYDPNANTNDGSCILDCTYLLDYQSYVDNNYDNSISNYYCNMYVTNGTYTIEQAISFGYNCDCVILGCTDSTAINYNEGAFVDDCSCIYEDNCSSVSVTGGSYPTEVSWNIVDENGDTVLSGNAPECQNFCFNDGCYTINMIDSYGDGWNNAVLSIDEYDYTFTTGSSAIAPFGYNDDNCIVEGCTNSLADNYNEEANYDDGSCEYSCEYLLTYESYVDLGYDYTTSNYLCFDYVSNYGYTVEYVEDSFGYNCDCVITGCTDPEANNYDETAFVDDCSCTYDNECPAISFSTSDTSFGWQINNMEGETVAEHNFNGINGGSYCGNYCFEDGCYIINMTAYYGNGWYQTSLNIGDDSFTLTSGYEGISTYSYNYEMSCEVGCTNPDASNYNPEAVLDDGSCALFGCTITTACNYDENATAFDGSCYYCFMDDCITYPIEDYDCEGNCYDLDEDGVCDDLEISGCMDSEACNYDPNATNEGDCQYPEPFYDCSGSCLNDNDTDLICNEIDNCPLVYNPNQEDINNDGIGDACDGVSLQENNDFEWTLYPNPLTNYTKLKFTNPNSDNFDIRIITLTGKLIYSSSTKNTEYSIENKFVSGYYIIELESNNNLKRDILIVE